jgi:hypothetical protein
MVSQLLAGPAAPSDPASVASWFGALQAQDLQSALWAFGVRLPSTTRDAVERAVADRTVLRTWAMRGTLHFVAATDARWVLHTAGVRALRTASQRWKTLGLDQATADAAVEAFAAALTRSPVLTRAAMLAALRAAGIGAEGQRGYHLLMYAAQIGVTCVGPNVGKEQTFALLSDFAPEQRDLAGDEALAELATRYFRSHGPATSEDFQRWAGLPASAARTGIGGAHALQVYDADSVAVYADPTSLEHSVEEPVVRLLPGFDEFVIGYRDRTSSIAPGRMHDVVPGGNGVFRPTVLADGMIVGTWTRKVTRAGVRVDVQFFHLPARRVQAAVDDAVQAYVRFLHLPLVG